VLVGPYAQMMSDMHSIHRIGSMHPAISYTYTGWAKVSIMLNYIGCVDVNGVGR